MATLEEKSLAIEIAKTKQVVARLVPESEPDDLDRDIRLILIDAFAVDGIDWVWCLHRTWLLDKWESYQEASECLVRLVSGDVEPQVATEEADELRETVKERIGWHLDEMEDLFTWNGDELAFVEIDGENIVIMRYLAGGKETEEIDRF